MHPSNQKAEWNKLLLLSGYTLDEVNFFNFPISENLIRVPSTDILTRLNSKVPRLLREFHIIYVIQFIILFGSLKPNKLQRIITFTLSDNMVSRLF